MPCTKCENGKYKWGKTGECKYDSKEACEKANKKNYNKMRPTPLGKTYEQYEKELKEYKEINLSKVERVELSIIEDAKKLYDKGQNSYASALTGGQSVLVKLQAAINNFEKAEKEFEIAEKMAKELGVDMPGKALRSQAKEWLKDSNKFFASLKKNL